MRLDPGEQLQLRSNATRKFLEKETGILCEHFNFVVKTVQKKWLTDRGVELSVYPNELHSHPACKMLENHLLYRVVPSLLTGFEDLHFLTIKQKKLDKLKKSFKGVEIGEAINRVVTSRDLNRFGSKVPPERLNLPKCSNLFIHDELHYWTVSQIITFLEIYQPNRVVATFVYPAEAIFGYKSSLNPAIYSFELSKDEVIFSPDGVVTESYVQPIDCGRLLAMSRIECSNGCYAVDLQYTIGAHHVFTLNRVSDPLIIHEKNRFFGPYQCVDAGDLFNWDGRVALPGIEIDVLQKVILYLFSLKKPDPQSAVAKLRQMMADDVNLESMWVVRDLANRVAKFGGKWSDDSCYTVVRDWFCDLIPNKVGDWRLRLFDDFDRNLMKLRPLVFNLEMDYKGFDLIGRAQEVLNSWLEVREKIYTPYDSSVLDHLVSPDELKKKPERRLYRRYAPEKVCDGPVSFFKHYWYSGAIKYKRGTVYIGENPKGTDVTYGPERNWPIVPYVDFSCVLLGIFVRSLKMLEHFRLDVYGKEPQEEVEGVALSDQEEIISITSDDKITPYRPPHLRGSTELFLESKGIHSPKERPRSSQGFTRGRAFAFSLKSAGDRISVYKLEGHISFDSSNWQKVGKRLARFYSMDPKLAYFHDSVVYQTFQPEEDLALLMERASKSFGVNFNTALVQEYLGDSIPKHKDDEDCYDGDMILTINTKGSAKFCVWEKSVKKIYNLEQGTVLAMHSDSREVPHSIEGASRHRTSITLRVQGRQISFDKAFKASGGTRCLLNAFAKGTKEDERVVCQTFEEKMFKSIAEDGLTDKDAYDIASTLGIAVNMVEGDKSVVIGDGDPSFSIRFHDHHFELLEDKEQGSTNTILGDESGRESNEDLGLLFHDMVVKDRLFTSDGLYSTDAGRAKQLALSLLAGHTGVNCSFMREGFRIVPGAKNDKEARSALNNLGNSIEMDITAITGFAGSGKSYGIQKILNDSPFLRKGTLVISPRVRLAEDWKSKVKNLPVCTFESALKRDRRKYHTIVLDEITLFPPGYVDLLIYTDLRAKGGHKRYVAIGDPLQAGYYCETDNLRLGSETFYSHFRATELNYGFSTHRLNRKVAKVLGIETSSAQAGDKSLKVCPDLPTAKTALGGQQDVVLVPSRMCKNRFSGVNCITYGESQGLTFKRGSIYLNEDSRVCSDHHVMVALTRFTENVNFVFDAKGGLNVYKANCKGLLARVLSNQTISKPFLMGMSAVELKFNTSLRGAGRQSRRRRNAEKRREMYNMVEGQDEMDREERLEGDPWQKAQIFLGQRPIMQKVEVDEPEPAKESNRVHLPINVLRPSRLEMDRIPDKDFREIISRSGRSDQFREERRQLDPDVEDLPQVGTAESIYMNHYNADDVTFWAAVKKRLRFAEPEVNFRKMQKKAEYGRYMATEFLKRVKIDGRRDNNLLADCVNEFEKVKLKKSSATLGSNSSRSDPDAKADEVKIFMKTQLCTKFEKRFCAGKAGQTIACFHHNVLNHFSPYCRYMERKISEALPDYIYVHQKKNFSVLNEFVQKRFKGGTCVESDYEAYDASQDATVLAFEVTIMEHMQMDPEFIEDYKLMKCMLGSKLGSLAIMRFTGEFCTFLFNTLANIAFTNLRYIWHNETVLFAGDDMCAFGDLPVDYNHDSFFNRLTLKAKVNRVDHPMFCGWRLTKFGLFKEPRLILDRLNVCKEKDSLIECVNSYFEEFSYAYNMGFRIEVVMDSEQIAAHQTCIRKFLSVQKYLSRSNFEKLRDICPDAAEYSSD